MVFDGFRKCPFFSRVFLRFRDFLRFSRVFYGVARVV